MHISKRLLTILITFLILSYGLGYLSITPSLPILYIFLGVCIGAIWVLSSDVDYLISKLFKLTLPEDDINFLRSNWYLASLIPDNQWVELSHRIRQLYLGNEYRGSTEENQNVPHGLMLITAATAAFVEYHAQSPAFNDCVYAFNPDTFISPIHPYPHVEEWYIEDRAFLFSIRHISKSQIDPLRNLDILLYTHLTVLLDTEKADFKFSDEVDLIFFADQLKKSGKDLHTAAASKCIELAKEAISHRSPR